MDQLVRTAGDHCKGFGIKCVGFLRCFKYPSPYGPFVRMSNYAFKPIAEQALRSKQPIVPQRLNAALGVKTGYC